MDQEISETHGNEMEESLNMELPIVQQKLILAEDTPNGKHSMGNLTAMENTLLHIPQDLAGESERPKKRPSRSDRNKMKIEEALTRGDMKLSKEERGLALEVNHQPTTKLNSEASSFRSQEAV